MRRLVLTSGEVVKHGVSAQTQFAEGLPLIQGDRTQLQQERSYTGHSPLWIVASDDWRKGDAMARNAGATVSEHHRFRDIPGPWKTGHGKLGSLGFGVLLSHLRSAPNG